jgi:O-antigen/teichoic acid export membrane protein
MTARPVRGFRRNVLWTVSGNMVYGLCQWGLIAVIARLSTAELVGQFALGLAITAPVYMFTNLQLRAIQATDAEGAYRFGDYLAARIVSTSVGFAAIAGYVLTWEGAGSARGEVILCLAAAKAFEAISDVVYALPQREERMDRVARSLIARGVLSLIVVGFALQLTGSLVVAMAGLASLWLILLLGLDLPMCRRVLVETAREGSVVSLRPTFSRGTLRSILWMGVPLGIAQSLLSLQTNIPRYVVDYFAGERALGHFAAMAYLMVIGTRFMHSLGQSLAPRLARYHVAANGSAFRGLYLRMLAGGVAAGLIGVAVAAVAGSPVLGLLYGPEYAAYDTVFLWIMVAAGIAYLRILMDYAMIATRWIRIQVVLLLASTLVVTIASIAWVPRLGISGAAFAMVAAGATHLTGNSIVNWIILRSSKDWNR